MYIVNIIEVSSGKKVSPSFFTGTGEEYPKLKDGIEAAEKFIAENFENKEEYNISYRIIGCL